MRRLRTCLRRLLLPGSALLVLASGCAEPDDSIDIVFSPCDGVLLVPMEATPDEEGSILEAAEMWNELGALVTVLPHEATSEEIPVRFEVAAPVFFGVYRDELGDIVINRTVTDFDERAIVVAHELGHAFGLEHVTERTSVMNEGNLTVSPTEADLSELAFAWPGCAL